MLAEILEVFSRQREAAGGVVQLIGRWHRWRDEQGGAEEGDDAGDAAWRWAEASLLVDEGRHICVKEVWAWRQAALAVEAQAHADFAP